MPCCAQSVSEESIAIGAACECRAKIAIDNRDALLTPARPD